MLVEDTQEAGPDRGRHGHVRPERVPPDRQDRPRVHGPAGEDGRPGGAHADRPRSWTWSAGAGTPGCRSTTGRSDNIVGILNTKHLFSLITLGHVVILEDALYPATFIDPEAPVSVALRLFKKSRRPMAIVRDSGQAGARAC